MVSQGKEFLFGDLTLRAKASYAAHVFKAVVKQHHRCMTPLLSRCIDPQGVVFDIGGHAGQYAKLLARIARRGRIYSFEPSGYARSILRLAVKINGFTNIVVVPKGLGDAPGSLTLSTPLKSQGTFRFGLAHLGETRRDGPIHREVVEVTTIDHFAREEGLQRLDFIKVDVEGWEKRILEGGAETIGRFRPALLVELIDAQLARAGDSLEKAWALLESWGYRAAVRLDGKTSNGIDGPQDSEILWLAD